jgi:hypothetical protein
MELKRDLISHLMSPQLRFKYENEDYYWGKWERFFTMRRIVGLLALKAVLRGSGYNLYWVGGKDFSMCTKNTPLDKSIIYCLTAHSLEVLGLKIGRIQYHDKQVKDHVYYVRIVFTLRNI